MIAVEKPGRRLVFVYNADSGLFNAALDTLHKKFMPQTYKCSLCFLTFDTFQMKEEWSAFLERSEFFAEFYHKNEMALPEDMELPVILENEKPFCSAEELNALSSIDDLMTLIEEKLIPPSS